MTITHHALPVEGGELPLTLARGAGQHRRERAAIIIMPSIFGVPSDLQAQMEELADDASLVIAIDPFFRDGGGVVPYDQMGAAIARLQSFDLKRAYRDLADAIAWARSQDGGASLIALGICFGGGYVLRAAAEGLVDGVVSWHGSRMEGLVHRAPHVRCPLRLHFGDVDPLVPKEAVEALRAAFADRANVKIVEHEGAAHGFSHRTGPAYQPKAERAGMSSLRELARN